MAEGSFYLLQSGIYPTLTTTPVVYWITSHVQTDGWYFLSLSTMIWVDAGDGAAFCYDSLNSTGAAGQYGGSSLVGGYQQISINDALYITAGDYAQVACYSSNGDGASFIYNGGLTATLISSFFNGKSAEGHPHKRKNLLKPPK
jgi:hypothetical protein